MKFFRFDFLDLACRQTGLILSRKANGFSLIELMVAVGILILINTMIFAKYPEFSQKMALKRTSEEIALTARQAQAYALGIKRSASIGGDYFGFGIHFDKSVSNQKSLILFTDFGQGNSQPNKQYDGRGGCGQPQTECFQEFKIDTGDYISNLECDSCSGSVDKLDIVYPRATSIAAISADGIVCGSCSYSTVTIKSPGGKEKYIKIWISGQISVE